MLKFTSILKKEWHVWFPTAPFLWITGISYLEPETVQFKLHANTWLPNIKIHEKVKLFFTHETNKVVLHINSNIIFKKKDVSPHPGSDIAVWRVP